jgi:hypothetical protein
MSPTDRFSEFTARLRELVSCSSNGLAPSHGGPPADRTSRLAKTPNPNRPEAGPPAAFNGLALELFRLQFDHNAPYRRHCEAQGLTPATVQQWPDIPSVPTAAFKEWEMSCLPARQRTAVFHSSRTTGQHPSRHFHSDESLAVYELSLWPWFAAHLLGPDCARRDWQLVMLTPSPRQAPHSSLVHMFETVRRRVGSGKFSGHIGADDSWSVDTKAVTDALMRGPAAKQPVILLGTAFGFVHLLDDLAAEGLKLVLPKGSRVLETGGYKGRCRSLPKAELHRLITQRLGIPSSNIVCEYGMSELSSQAYDQVAGQGTRAPRDRRFHFPAWVRVQVVSPETGAEVAEGETGLLRIFDLANVFSVMAIQTEDLGVRRGEGFELIGRAALAEPRGCSLMAA